MALLAPVSLTPTPPKLFEKFPNKIPARPGQPPPPLRRPHLTSSFAGSSAAWERTTPPSRTSPGPAPSSSSPTPRPRRLRLLPLSGTFLPFLSSYRRIARTPSLQFNRPDPPLRGASPQCSDELSCNSGSSSYSCTSARSCVSDSARRGRPVDPLRVLAVVASLRRINPKVSNPIPRLLISARLQAASSAVTH